jgi:hypothetical protein
VYSLGMEAMHMFEAVRRRGAANAVLVLGEQVVTETTQPSWMMERVLLSDWEPGLCLSG